MLNHREEKLSKFGLFGVFFLGYAPGYVKGVIESDLAIPQSGGPENWLHIYGFPAILISLICLIFCFFGLNAVYRKAKTLKGWEAKLGIWLAFFMYVIGILLQFNGVMFFPLFLTFGASLAFVGVLLT